MEKMFVNLEGHNSAVAESAVATAEPIRSMAATASHRCKLYRAQLDQAFARRNSAPQGLPRFADAAGKSRPVPILAY